MKYKIIYLTTFLLICLLTKDISVSISKFGEIGYTSLLFALSFISGSSLGILVNKNNRLKGDKK